MIVDAHDKKNEVVFKFGGVEKATARKSQPVGGVNADEKNLPPILRGLDYDPNLIQPPVHAIKTTEKEFDKLKLALRKNPQALAQSVRAGNSDGAPKEDKVVNAPLPGPIINNPIELPEKN